MSLIVWDAVGERFYETGVDHGVLYQVDAQGNYVNGVPWNGLTNVSQSPSGAEPQKLYADNMNYLTMYSAEEFGVTIEAYTYPDEFAQNDGSATPVDGVRIGQQGRKPFGLCYRTKIGNDVAGDDLGYMLHLVYGCRCSPSERAYATINDSPEALSFSWEVSTTPVQIAGFKPSAYLEIDSTKFTADADKAKLTTLENMLFGTNGSGNNQGTDPVLPLPMTVLTTLGYVAPQQ